MTTIATYGFYSYNSISYHDDKDDIEHPYRCLALAWTKCFMLHAEDYLERNKIYAICYFTIDKNDEENISSLKFKFLSYNLSDKNKKVIKNILKTCNIFEILQNSCSKPCEITFN